MQIVNKRERTRSSTRHDSIIAFALETFQMARSLQLANLHSYKATCATQILANFWVKARQVQPKRHLFSCISFITRLDASDLPLDVLMHAKMREEDEQTRN